MFTRLRLTNFKAWKDTGDVDFKPVTMLLGTNSSGKPKSGSYPVAGNPGAGLGGPMTGAMRSLT